MLTLWDMSWLIIRQINDVDKMTMEMTELWTNMNFKKPYISLERDAAFMRQS